MNPKPLTISLEYLYCRKHTHLEGDGWSLGGVSVEGKEGGEESGPMVG